ncbi:MAG: methyl-accepting chemotaxis protein [Bacillota bacterium]
MQGTRLNLTVKTLIIMGIAGILVIGVVVGAGFFFMFQAIKAMDVAPAVYVPALQSLGLKMLGVSVLMAFIGACFAFGLSRMLTAPVVRLTAVAARVAEGDLTVTVPRYRGNDEIGDLTGTFERLLQMLRDLIGSLQEAAGLMAGTSESLSTITQQADRASAEVTRQMAKVLEDSRREAESLAAGGQSLRQLQDAIAQIAAGAQEQAEAVSGVTSLAMSVAQGGEAAAAAAAKASEAALAARDESMAGRAAVDQTISGMEQLAETVRRSASSLTELGQRSASVREITALITDIAEQTNLLALNAAIEAARAGEHGRGFAVVADEVRKLAERSAAAIQDVERVLGDIQAEIARNIDEGRRTLALTESAQSLSHQAGQALERIQQQTREAEERVQQAAAASRDSAAQGQAISQGAERVAAVVEENSAATEEMAAGAASVMQAASVAAAQAADNAAAADQVTEQMNRVAEAVGRVAAASGELLRLSRDVQGRISQYRV